MFENEFPALLPDGFQCWQSRHLTTCTASTVGAVSKIFKRSFQPYALSGSLKAFGFLSPMPRVLKSISRLHRHERRKEDHAVRIRRHARRSFPEHSGLCPLPLPECFAARCFPLPASRFHMQFPVGEHKNPSPHHRMRRGIFRDVHRFAKPCRFIFRRPAKASACPAPRPRAARRA